jgi:hypothetical protein
MGKLDVTQFAAELGLPVALLLEQLHAAGGKQSGASLKKTRRSCLSICVRPMEQTMPRKK